MLKDQEGRLLRAFKSCTDATTAATTADDARAARCGSRKFQIFASSFPGPPVSPQEGKDVIQSLRSPRHKDIRVKTGGLHVSTLDVYCTGRYSLPTTVPCQLYNTPVQLLYRWVQPPLRLRQCSPLVL